MKYTECSNLFENKTFESLPQLFLKSDKLIESINQVFVYDNFKNNFDRLLVID